MTAPAAPTEAELHDAALAYLARYAATRASLARVLLRCVDRWQRSAGNDDGEAVAACRAAIDRVVARLVAAGVVNDAAFAEARARSLGRAGRSRRAVAAHLAARGVDAETARAVVPDDPEAELAAALALARRRRLGPFRTGPADAVVQRRELGSMARAGFDRQTAMRALRFERDAAEDLLRRHREP
jgi:regulatory protein